MWWIIALLIIVFTVFLIKDTHVEVYSYKGRSVIEEYNMELPIWMVILIILIGAVPILNITLFIMFVIFYVVHATWNPRCRDEETHVFSLRGENWVGKILLKIKKILTVKV